MTLVEEEYEASEMSDEAFALYYPDTMTPNHPMYQRRMYELQLRLIQNHMPFMFSADRQRAISTIFFLKQQLRGADL